MDSSTGGSLPATKEMRCYVAELDSDGKVVMVEKVRIDRVTKGRCLLKLMSYAHTTIM